jgi:hypothetical protein
VEVSAADPAVGRTAEADLKNSLANEKAKAVTQPGAPPADPQPNATAKLAETDYVLYNALTVLKGMIVAGGAHTV